MTFEDTLRSEVRRQADALVLPDRNPEQAAVRARRLRNRRRAGVATVAVAAALAAGLPPVLDESRDATEMGPAGLPASGPLDLTWQHDADGLSNVRTLTQDGDGTLYALSTAPGTSATGMVPGPYARGLYRLEDDGTWAPLPLDGDPSYVEDLAAGGGGLYTISTAPTADGGVKATLASSSDEGASWAPQEVELPAPPSDAVDWRQATTLEVEATSSATLAVVATSWEPEMADLFPETVGGVDLVVERTDAGYELQRIAPAGPGPKPPPATDAPTTTTTTAPGAATTAPPTSAAPPTTTTTTGPGATTTAPPAPSTTTGPGTDATAPPAPSTTTTRAPGSTITAPPTTGVPGSTITAPPTTMRPGAAATTGTTAPPAPTTTTGPAGPPATWPGGSASGPGASGGETVDTVTWAQLGIDGPDDLGPTYQALRLDGGEWVALDGAGAALDGLTGLELDAAAGGFVATGFAGDEATPRAFTSDDGSSWGPITAPGAGAVYGMGSALVTLGPDGGHQVSTDAGATWSDFDLTEAGVDRDTSCPWGDAGPLGVAMVCSLADGPALAVSSDLRDWTVTPLREVVGAEVTDDLNGLAVHVGDDRVVVAANGATPLSGGGTAPSATAVGVPTRS